MMNSCKTFNPCAVFTLGIRILLFILDVVSSYIVDPAWARQDHRALTTFATDLDQPLRSTL